MPLYRFLILSLVIFFLGIAVLYNGLNRVPFRNMGTDPKHQHGHSSLLLNEMIGKRAVNMVALEWTYKHTNIM